MDDKVVIDWVIMQYRIPFLVLIAQQMSDVLQKSEFSPRPRAKSTYFDFNTFKTIQTSQEFHLHSIKTIRSHFEVVQEQDSNFDKFRQFFRNKSRVSKNIKSSCFNFKPVTVKMNSVGLQKASSEYLCENSSTSVVKKAVQDST